MKNMKRLDLVQLYTCLLRDVARACDCSVAELEDAERQLKALYAVTGMTGLTTLLPAIGKCLDKALATDEPLQLPDWMTTKSPYLALHEKTGLPTLVHSAWEFLFHSDNRRPRITTWSDGYGYDTTDGHFEHEIKLSVEVYGQAAVTCVRGLRQILYFMYKLSLPYDSKTTQKVIEEFEATEAELSSLDETAFEGPVIAKARELITRVLHSFDHRDITPRHGPGAVATGERYHRKMIFSRLYTEVERVYPYTEYFTLVNSDLDHLELTRLKSLDISTAKVILVQKDSRGPRLISAEPLEMQWLQQGLGRKLSAFLEQHKWSRGFVNFTDQSVNQLLALRASEDRKNVTLDMKEASDRVDLRLVKALFRDCPILEGLIALRSGETKLPDGRILPLRKYAPMGSALCFPVEALCFWALSVAVISTFTEKTCYQARRLVYVYGDDLIVPREYYPLVLQFLPSVGLKFNEGKCCTEGFFRESCGCEAFLGFDVKPTRLRAVWSHSRQPETLAAYVSYANSLRAKGYWSSADYIASGVETLWGPLPVISPKAGQMFSEWYRKFRKGTVGTASCPCLGWVDDCVTSHENDTRLKRRFNKRLQRTEYLVWGLRPVVKRFRQFPRQELFVSLASKLMTQDSRSKRRLYALHRRVTAKRCWAPTE